MSQVSLFKKYLDPAVLSNINNLELRAKLVVEGFITGLHKSPFHGFSVEFSQHRPYNYGDNLRYIDWKVFNDALPSEDLTQFRTIVNYTVPLL